MGNYINSRCFLPPDPPGGLIERTKYITLKNGAQIPILEFMKPKYDFIIIFSHANATDLGHSSRYIAFLSRHLRASIIGYEYLGYGNTKCAKKKCDLNFIKSSHPSEKGCLMSMCAVLHYVNKHYPSKKLILMGQSIGTGPTVHFANAPNVVGAVLLSPFRSCIKVVWDTNLLSSIDVFRNDAKIKHVKVPVFIIHGEEDKIVPISHGKQLWNIHDKHFRRGRSVVSPGAVPGAYPPLWLEKGDHNSLLQTHPRLILSSLNTFIKYLDDMY